MRVYLPATAPVLHRLRETGELAAADSPALTAHAVTPALREWYAESDLEELEQAAFYDAERGSLRLLADDPGAVRRRVVIAADVPDSAVARSGVSDEDRSVVTVHGAVALAAVASVHVDDVDAVSDVTAAIGALPAAGRGDEDAQFVVDGAEGHDLLWYDVTELDDLVVDLRQPPA